MIFEARSSMPKSVAYKPTSVDHDMMSMALHEAEQAAARGDIAVGAVFAAFGKNGEISHIFAAGSTEYTTQDLTAHAEVNAYKLAQPIFGRSLGSFALYSTVEPCVSCTYYTYKSSVPKLVFASKRNESPHIFSSHKIKYSDILNDSNRTMLVVPGFRKNESKDLLKKQTRRSLS